MLVYETAIANGAVENLDAFVVHDEEPRKSVKWKMGGGDDEKISGIRPASSWYKSKGRLNKIKSKGG